MRPDKSSKKNEIKKSFQLRIVCWTRFLMMPVTFLYSEYIDRQKFTEQTV